MAAESATAVDGVTLGWLLGAVGLGALLMSVLGQRWLPAPAPPMVYGYRVVRRYSHDPTSFTQGLLWANGSLYESTGLYGRSLLRELRLREDGGMEVLREVKLKRSQFGEGLAYVGHELRMLLWQKPDVLRFDAQAGPGGHLSIKQTRMKTPLSDGWGLVMAPGALLATDSGPDVFHLDPSTLELKSTVRVRDAGRPVEMINELEMVDGELWANVYGTDCIARIDPLSGAVHGWVDLTGMLDWEKATMDAGAADRTPPDVMNGIAWDPESRRLFVTGKLWPTLFEIEVVPHPMATLEEVRERCIPPTNLFRH